jgi:Fe2+ or Zn2+ uptake regulation protein
MSCAPQITQELRLRGLRLTSQRLAILETLRHSGKHLTPREVYEKARESVPGLMETTVYRTLEFLVKNRLAFAAQIASGKLAYEAASHDHHHILCRNCHTEMEIPHRQLEELYGEIEKSTGYRLTTGHLTFFGLCPDCQ